MKIRTLLAMTVATAASSAAMWSASAPALPLLVDASHETVVNPTVLIRADRRASRVHFDRFDTDGDGTLSDKEAEAMPGVAESVYGADDFAEIDTDSNGEIDFEEFATYLNTDDAELVPLVATDTDVEDPDEDRPGEIDDIDVDDLASSDDDSL